MEKRESHIYTLMYASMVIIGFLILVSYAKFTGFALKSPMQVKFYFFDESTNCSLDGYLFFGDNLIGKTKDGYYYLTYEEYYNYYNDFKKDISLFGDLGECFKENSQFYFDKHWNSFEINSDLFDSEAQFNFKSTIQKENLRQPALREMQGFIKTSEVEEALTEMETNDNLASDLSLINRKLNSIITYKNDSENYWQFPKESLSLKTGDCEDYATTLLSLYTLYNNSLQCFNIVFSTHISTICYIGETYYYFDQGKTELSKKITKNTIYSRYIDYLWNLNNEYLNTYGLNTNESKVYYAYNKNEFIEFDNYGDFVMWEYYLKDKNYEGELFSVLEKQAEQLNTQKQANLTQEAENKSNQNQEETSEIGELSTLSSNPEELPVNMSKSLYFKLLIALCIVFVILFILLIVSLIKHKQKELTTQKAPEQLEDLKSNTQIKPNFNQTPFPLSSSP